MMMNDFENRLDEIRADLYEQTKGMSTQATVASTNAAAQKIAAQHSIRIVKDASAPQAPKRKIV